MQGEWRAGPHGCSDDEEQTPSLFLQPFVTLLRMTFFPHFYTCDRSHFADGLVSVGELVLSDF